VPNINGTHSQDSVTCAEGDTTVLSESFFDHIDDTAFSENIRLQSELIELYISLMNEAKPEHSRSFLGIPCFREPSG
jgi:hypothetical protein